MRGDFGELVSAKQRPLTYRHFFTSKKRKFADAGGRMPDYYECNQVGRWDYHDGADEKTEVAEWAKKPAPDGWEWIGNASGETPDAALEFYRNPVFSQGRELMAEPWELVAGIRWAIFRKLPSE